ncbi:MAG TPA: hypothetical protein ENN17_02110 [bacterium]|nr:hypothetical protein [bacterium]
MNVTKTAGTVNKEIEMHAAPRYIVPTMRKALVLHVSKPVILRMRWMNEPEQVYAATRGEWRAWLEKNQGVEKMIREGRMTEAGFARVEAAKRSGEWEKDRSIPDETGIPPDLRAALERIPPAKENFEGFAPSYRKLYLRWVADAKRAETREKRIRKVVERAEKNLKPDINM